MPWPTIIGDPGTVSMPANDTGRQNAGLCDTQCG